MRTAEKTQESELPRRLWSVELPPRLSGSSSIPPSLSHSPCWVMYLLWVVFASVHMHLPIFLSVTHSPIELCFYYYVGLSLVTYLACLDACAISLQKMLYNTLFLRILLFLLTYTVDNRIKMSFLSTFFDFTKTLFFLLLSKAVFYKVILN